MAAGLDGLGEFLTNAAVGKFEAKPYYEPETDSLIFYAREESSYSKRISKYFTLFLSNDDESFVGLEIKGVKTIVKALEGFGQDVTLTDPVSLKDEDGQGFDLFVIVRQALVPDAEAPAVLNNQYSDIGKATSGVSVSRRDLCRTT